MGVLAFGVAQIAHSLTLLAVYVRYVAAQRAQFGFTSVSDLLPARPTNAKTRTLFDPEQYSLAWVFSGQSVFKHMLTEGDKIVLSITCSLHDQGVYAMAQNYGSLAARLLLSPFEEMSRVIFGKINTQITQLRGGDAKKLVDELRSMLQLLLKLAVYLGALFLVFGVRRCWRLLLLLCCRCCAV